MNEQILLSVELMCVIFLLVQILATIFNGKEKPRSSKTLCYVMGALIVSCFSDVISLQAFEAEIPNAILYTSAFIASTGGTIAFTIFIFYCYTYMRERTSVNKWFFYVPIIITSLDVLSIACMFILGRFYTVVDGQLIRIARIPAYAIVIPSIMLIYLPCVALTKRKEIGKRSVFLLGFFGIFPIIVSILVRTSDLPNLIFPASAVAVSIVNLLQENKVTREQTAALNRVITKNEKKLQERYDIIQSMSKVYFASFYIDLINNTYTELSSTDSIRNLVGETGKAQESLYLACEKLILPEFTADMKEFLNLSTINERLRDKSSISQNYIGINSGWSMALLIAGDRDENGNLLHIFYACRTIHDEKAKEAAQDRKFEEYNEIVTNAGIGIWYIFLNDDYEPRMKANKKMLELLGIEDENLTEEEVYNWWFCRIAPEALPSVLQSVAEMKANHFSENTYSWMHPKSGNIFVRCGGTSKRLEDGTWVLSGYHADVTHTVVQENIHRRAKQLEENQKTMNQMNVNLLGALGTVVEFRSLESGDHVKRVMTFTKILLDKLKEHYPEYRLTDEQIIQMARAAALHDVGKIAIPDEILKAPRKLTQEEFSEMKKHTSYGCEILEKFKFTENNDFYKYSYDICRWHHEKADGKGYPDGLTEKEIPIYCQVTAVADCFDALVSKRVYKDAKTCEESYKMIMNGECGAFSANVLNCFEMAKAELFQTVNAS